MATLVREEIEVHLCDLGYVGIPDGYVVVNAHGELLKVGFSLVGAVENVFEPAFVQDLQAALTTELKANKLPQAQRVFVGA